MANANGQRAFTESIAAKVTLVAAGLLILFGVVIQLGELGYGHINANNWWVVSTAIGALWRVVTRVNAPGMDEVLRFWPLVIVSIGLGILMLKVEKQ